MPVAFTRFDDNGDPVEDLHYTADEAAAMLNVSTATVYRRVRSGEWPALRLTDRSVFLSKTDLSTILDLSHQDGTLGRIPDQSETPPKLGTPVDLDETGPLE